MGTASHAGLELLGICNRVAANGFILQAFGSAWPPIDGNPVLQAQCLRQKRFKSALSRVIITELQAVGLRSPSSPQGEDFPRCLRGWFLCRSSHGRPVSSNRRPFSVLLQPCAFRATDHGGHHRGARGEHHQSGPSYGCGFGPRPAEFRQEAVWSGERER
jgi:hypothetical protein